MKGTGRVQAQRSIASVDRVKPEAAAQLCPLTPHVHVCARVMSNLFSFKSLYLCFHGRLE
ncbi:hypothetical protein Q5P01_017807 [Channa striata]|uniref:Uncharacterized protein n=1 Tax=Channa striata TaxID=64152 RepID=A0AA88SJH7_CHASR|nr:hypothetical protein Q5P01_017807 [Channa striata]